jgi:hypothetical protein
MNMHKSTQRRSRHMLTGLLLVGIAFPSLVSAQANDAHHRDYVAALAQVSQSEAQILAAMKQVQSGQVAHYDFLQNEHIELIRHARALAWPPGNISQPDKDALRADAVALLSSAESLEWIIADFLRTVAQVRSATSNTLDIASQAAQGTSGTLSASLKALQVQTLMFMASGYNEGWEALAGAYDAVLTADISEKTNRELQFQRERLVLFTPQLQVHTQALLESDVDVRAMHLQALFDRIKGV